ncbi:cryptochrome/photolyase family protein [Roseobacter sp.]|uniref:cryptochrome/photolyase family protein n=1 Tax=Roseobacter sp. TaxID=1907202 RepID=UPI00385FF80C
MKLRLVLADQLNKSITSLRDLEVHDVILMAEVRSEATYVKHHKKKIAFLFSAMRHFAQDLISEGANVEYVFYDTPDNSGSLFGEVQRVVESHKIDKVVVTSPGEHRLLSEMQGWSKQLDIPVEILNDDRFLSSVNEFADWAKGRKQLRMEFFYREMRRKYSVLMEPEGPTGGEWNYDAKNRKPPKEGLTIPPPFCAEPDIVTRDVMALVDREFADHFGDLEPFHYGVTRGDALAALDMFIETRLACFGDYQDAMIQGEAWMYHSHIALYLNCGLLEPLECVQKAEAAYRQGDVPLNSAEGFIRQIIGWREFVRGIYWLKMPSYKDSNYLEAHRALPEFYWTAETNMNCLRQSILETKQNAYAHHIQRLMVLGNFALLAGLRPDQVNEWYLLVYADAYEWVELPNVSGMVLFADGGLLASKPYAASGSYIKKMSNYCDNCAYKVAAKNGSKACPFNYLYWDFVDRNSEKLRGNPRMGFVFGTLDRMSQDKRLAIKDDTSRFFSALKSGDTV